MARADRNLVEPLSNTGAWTSWASRFTDDASRATGDGVVGPGSILMVTNSMGPGGQNTATALGPALTPGGMFTAAPGDRIVGGALFFINSRTGNAAAYVQVNYYNAAFAFIGATIGNVLTAVGLGRSTVDVVAPANTAWVTFSVIANEGVPNPPAGAINAYVGQPQFYIGVGALPAYKAPDGLAPAYDVRLGPLAFTWPSDTLEETLGDTLEAVGAALTPGERRPRPMKIPVRIEGADSEAIPANVGRALRRQARQLLENGDWLQQGLYLWLRADDELAGWVRVSGGTIRESDPGTAFGIYELELETPYLVGRPATHLPGRRLDLGDRRTGAVPRDTRGTIYSTDFSTYALPDKPLILPGPLAGARSTFKRVGGVPANTSLGPRVAGRRLYVSVAGVDGEVVTYTPDSGALPHPAAAHLLLDEPGSVRVWDRTGGVDPNAQPSAQGDVYPDAIFGWERVLGAQLRNPRVPLAIDNGNVRLVWLSDALGFAFEWWDPAIGRYRREGTIAQVNAYHEASIVELTSERAVVSWRAGGLELRVILQRGWTHCRVEAYNDELGNAVIYYNTLITFTSVTNGAGAASFVKVLTAAGRNVQYATTTLADVFSGGGVGVPAYSTRLGAVVAQIGSPACSTDEVARWSLADARSVPILTSR